MGGMIPWLIGSTMVFMAANSALKTYATGASGAVLLGALALFCLGNWLMVPVMRGQGLGGAIVLSGIFQMVAISLLAWVAFGEAMSARQLVGIGLGVISVLLIAWPKEAVA